MTDTQFQKIIASNTLAVVGLDPPQKDGSRRFNSFETTNGAIKEPRQKPKSYREHFDNLVHENLSGKQQSKTDNSLSNSIAQKLIIEMNRQRRGWLP